MFEWTITLYSQHRSMNINDDTDIVYPNDNVNWFGHEIQQINCGNDYCGYELAARSLIIISSIRFNIIKIKILGSNDGGSIIGNDGGSTIGNHDDSNNKASKCTIAQFGKMNEFDNNIENTYSKS